MNEFEFVLFIMENRNEKIKVLIVEDEIIIAEDLKISLQELGYQVVGVIQNGISTLAFLEKQTPEIIIMDIMLEGEMNGIELSKIINQKYDIPIIYCSAYNDNDTVDQAVLTNPYGYILKPIEDRELRATIKIALYKQEMASKLKKSDERWQFALEGSGDAVWDWDILKDEIFYSKQWQNLFGENEYWQKSSIEKWKKVIHPNDFTEVWQKIEGHLSGETELFIAEYRMITNSGNIIWVLNRAKVMQRDIIQRPARMLGTLSDITERKKIEHYIIESEKKYRNLIETMNEGIGIVDEQENFTFVNDAAADIFAMDKKDLLKKNLADFVSEAEFAKIKQQTKWRKQNKDGQYELTIKNANKQDRILMVKTKPLFEQNIFIGVFGIFNDITEQRKYESEMMKQARLESLGILAGGIAHDFNNLLTAILSNIEYGKINLQNQTILERTLTDAAQAIKQAKKLTGQLLTFAKGGEPVIGKVNLKNLLAETVDFVLRGTNVSAKMIISDSLFQILADEGQMQQVINNLLINARQAMPEGGLIEITATNLHDLQMKKPMVAISIQDAGQGIPPELLPIIFDPFFTTKKEGTGLGLSTTYSIIKKHNGTIKIESKINEGTKVTIHLPATEEIGEVEAETIISNDTLTYKILILDDNDMILSVTQEMLSQIGHTVHTAHTGEIVIEMYKRELAKQTPYDLLILDLTIPNGLGGKEVIKELKLINPQVKAIVSSGYSSAPVISNFQDYGFSGAISKPYQIDDVVKTISDVMHT
jgi:PAS domain S-box-containing protein